MLWPDPMAAMKCFEPLHAKGIDVIMLLKQTQWWIFFAIMHKVGIDMEKPTLLV